MISKLKKKTFLSRRIATCQQIGKMNFFFRKKLMSLPEPGFTVKPFASIAPSAKDVDINFNYSEIRWDH